MEGGKKKIDINKFGEKKWKMRMEGSEGKREEVGREKGRGGGGRHISILCFMIYYHTSNSCSCTCGGVNREALQLHSL